MADHINMALVRLAAMQKECISGSDAVPRFFHQQESFPYWTNRIPDGAYELDSEDYDVRTYTALMRLYVGFVTEGFDGEVEQRLYGYIPLVEDYFNNNREGTDRKYLASTAYPTALDGMHDLGIRLTGMQVGLVPQGGVGGNASAAQLMYAEFSLEIPFHFPLDVED